MGCHHSVVKAVMGKQLLYTNNSLCILNIEFSFVYCKNFDIILIYIILCYRKTDQIFNYIKYLHEVY
jgi:hypothetical protein